VQKRAGPAILSEHPLHSKEQEAMQTAPWPAWESSLTVPECMACGQLPALPVFICTAHEEESWCEAQPQEGQMEPGSQPQW
jgi:hypothetical protein